MMQVVLRTVVATRYVTPLREGGSLPGLVEADDDGLYVCKFRGAGQGPKALAAEVVVGELARALGLPVPELVLIELDPDLGRAEPDPEIQDLLRASAGLNLGVDFLPGALPYAPAQPPPPELAADVVWLDALVENVDRTPRNPNMLRWHHRLWLIDHGAALFVHHGSSDPMAVARRPFAGVGDHVLLPAAGSIAEADERLAAAARPEEAAALVPDGWADGAVYAEHLVARLEEPREWVEHAEQARSGATTRARDGAAGRSGGGSTVTRVAPQSQTDPHGGRS